MGITAKPQANYQFAWTGDDAIDTSTIDGKIALQTYRRERDPGVLKLKPGGELTLFHCRPLSRGARLWCESIEGRAGKAAAAFQCGVVNITGLNGIPWTPQSMPAGWRDGETILSFDCLDSLEDWLPAEAITQIGWWILERATLGVPEKKVSCAQPGSGESPLTG